MVACLTVSAQRVAVPMQVPMMLLRAVLVALIVPPVWLAIHLLTAGTALNEPLAPWRRGILRPLLRFWADMLMRIGFGFWRYRVTGACLSNR